MISSRHVLAPNTPRPWMPVAIIGVLAVTAGFALPSALPAGMDLPKTNVAAESNGTSKLTYTPTQLPEAPDPKAMLTRLGIATVIVLTLCVGTFLLGKRWLGGAPNRSVTNSQLRLLETLALGNRCSIHLLLVANRQVLIAADSTGLKSVVPLPESFEHTLTAASGPDAVSHDSLVMPSQSAGTPVLTNSESPHGRYN
jgi:flagellar biogenesis protein FliO